MSGQKAHTIDNLPAVFPLVTNTPRNQGESLSHAITKKFDDND